MTNTAWFYSHGDKEQGPVSRAQLDALARSGQLKADDLVWHEGMEDWQTAASAGIVTMPSPKATANRQVAPPPQPVAADPPQTPTPRPSMPPSQSNAGDAGSANRTTSTPFGNLNREQLLRNFGFFVGQPMILFGLVLVLLGRGCDTLGDRFAGRASARAELTKNQFTDEWQRDAADLQQRIDTLRTKDDVTAADDERRDKLEDELEELQEDKRAEEQTLKRTSWRDLEIAARDSRQNHRLWSPWYHLTFVMGTFILSVGLFIVGFTATGSDRWICMVMLAIVLFSIYVVGSPWLPFGGGLGP